MDDTNRDQNVTVSTLHVIIMIINVTLKQNENNKKY